MSPKMSAYFVEHGLIVGVDTTDGYKSTQDKRICTRMVCGYHISSSDILNPIPFLGRFRANVFGGVVSERNHQIGSKHRHFSVKHPLEHRFILPLMGAHKVRPAATPFQHIVREELPAIRQIDADIGLLHQSLDKPKQHGILASDLAIVCAVESKWC